MRLTFQKLTRSTLVHVLGMGMAVVGGTIGAAKLGWLEPLELRVYDRMMQLRPGQLQDAKLLVVEITEHDLHRVKAATPSDRTLAQVMQTLQLYQPRVLGVDLYRDLPQGEGQAQLKKQFLAKNAIAIHRIGDQKNNMIPALSGVPPERVGFNDVLIDSDGVVRRALIFAEQATSFALQIAFTYLEKEGILPEEDNRYPGVLKLGKQIFLPIESASGAYQTVDASGHQILLNYRSVRAVRRITLSQVLDRQFDPSWVKDKVVLIGMTAISGKDFFYTPYSESQRNEHQLSGVELQAQVISQLIETSMGTRSLIRYLPNWMEGLWITGWVLLSSVVAWRLRQLVRLEIVNAGLLILIGGLGFAAFCGGVWVPIVAPIGGAIAAHLGAILHRAQQSQMQNRIVMTLLGQNTSKEVAQALWDNRHDLVQSGKLPGQKVMATMLFTDLHGFSAISEKLSPEELMAWLNEYLGAMTEEVQRHHGIVNKFTGDGLFAVFGVPIAHTTDAEISADAQNAVLAGLAMRSRLEHLNQQWASQGLKTVEMRVGICTGTVVVGSLGGKDRIEYGVIGDAVNTASRLESCAKERQADACRILISRSTQQYLAERFVLAPWGAMKLAGKQRSVRVYRVVSERLSSASEKDALP